MKHLANLVAASLLTTTLSLLSINILAGGTHSHKHADEPMVFDPTATEFGQYDPELKPTRTIEISMSDDMRFSPDVIEVNKGDVILFKHTNHGQLMHEFVLGTPDSLDEHAELMKKFPNMEHEEPYMIHVAPGESGAILWQFSESGKFSFGCLIPGHYQAGMKGTVMVGS